VEGGFSRRGTRLKDSKEVPTHEVTRGGRGKTVRNSALGRNVAVKTGPRNGQYPGHPPKKDCSKAEGSDLKLLETLSQGITERPCWLAYTSPQVGGRQGTFFVNAMGGGGS